MEVVGECLGSAVGALGREWEEREGEKKKKQDEWRRRRRRKRSHERMVSFGWMRKRIQGKLRACENEDET